MALTPFEGAMPAGDAIVRGYQSLQGQLTALSPRYRPPIDFRQTPYIRADHDRTGSSRPNSAVYDGYVYIVFWDSASKPRIARYPISSTPGGWTNRAPQPDIENTVQLLGWESLDLSTISGNPIAAITGDPHNFLSIGIDQSDGQIYIAGNMHNNVLRAVTANVSGWSAAAGWAALALADSPTSVAYPRFISFPDNTLVFMYREGTNNNATWSLAKCSRGALTKYSTGFIGDGGGTNGSYPSIAVSENGRLHMAWGWSPSSGAFGNDQIKGCAYAVSSDKGVTWKKSNGSSYALPIEIGDEESIADIQASTNSWGVGLTLIGETVYAVLVNPEITNPAVALTLSSTNNVAISQTLTLSGVRVGSATATSGGGTPFAVGDIGRAIIEPSSGGIGVITQRVSATVAQIKIMREFSGTSISSGNWSYGITVTAGSAIFVANDVGRRISSASGTVRLTGYSSTTVMFGAVDDAFASTTADVSSGLWNYFGGTNASLYRLVNGAWVGEQLTKFSTFFDLVPQYRLLMLSFSCLTLGGRALMMYRHMRESRGELRLMDLTYGAGGADVCVGKIDLWHGSVPTDFCISKDVAYFLECQSAASGSTTPEDWNPDSGGNAIGWTFSFGYITAMEGSQIQSILGGQCKVPGIEILSRSRPWATVASAVVNITDTGNPGAYIGPVARVSYREFGYTTVFGRYDTELHQNTGGNYTMRIRVLDPAGADVVTAVQIAFGTTLENNWHNTPWMVSTYLTPRYPVQQLCLYGAVNSNDADLVDHYAQVGRLNLV